MSLFKVRANRTMAQGQFRSRRRSRRGAISQDAFEAHGDRGFRVPRFRIPDRFKNLVLADATLLFPFCGSAPSGQEPLQI